MKILIQSCRIVDKRSKHNGKVRDVLISGGKIEKIGSSLPVGKSQVIKIKGLHLSPGWFDVRANFCDPGYEHRETVQSGLLAAAAGGFTGVATVPSTNPPTDSKAGIEYLRNKSAGSVVDLFPMGCLSKGRAGEELAELYDMQEAGAIAFTDDKQPIASAGLLNKGLLYTKGFNGIVASFPMDATLVKNGQVNEGLASVSTGLKGSPAIAEELQIARDLTLLEYSGSRLHIQAVSTAKSVDLIRQAKKKNLQVTCDVCAHHLLLQDSETSTFDSNFKYLPPLRGADDVKALIKGLKDGTIDAIASDHSPHDTEGKKLEFDRAEFGAIGLETAFGVARTGTGNALPLDELVGGLTYRARAAFNLPASIIEEGESANLTLFDPDLIWEFAPAHIKSKSSNTPFIGRKLIGKALGIINRGELVQH